MAGTITKSRDNTGHEQGAMRDLMLQHNKLVDDLETLRAKFVLVLQKLDADAGVTDTNYNALHTVAAATLTGAKIGSHETNAAFTS
jgi:hypothetical protein